MTDSDMNYINYIIYKMYDIYNIYGILKCVDSRIVHSRIKYCSNSLQFNYKKISQ